MNKLYQKKNVKSKTLKIPKKVDKNKIFWYNIKVRKVYKLTTIIIIILSSILIGVSGSYFLLYYKSKETISELVEESVEEVYPCKMFATVRYSQENEQTIVDMSRYEDLGIIGVTIDRKAPAVTEHEKKINNKPNLYSPAVVYKVGGHWLWKIL